MRTKFYTQKACMGQSGTLLLESIENDVNAFRAGRINDDICNWFFAHKLIQLEDSLPGLTQAQWLQAFDQLISNLHKSQQYDLDNWDESWGDKIALLFDYYQDENDSNVIRNYLWIDQGGYRMANK